MTEATPYWKFPKREKMQKIQSINNAGITIFASNALESLVRETIQNSLGARDSKRKPVHVEFSEYDIDADEFPDIGKFRQILTYCMDSGKEKESKELFKKALKSCERKIHVLRVSDFNTLGLTGAGDDKRGSRWNRLVLESGSPNDDGSAPGSFGIGKNAPLGCSSMRTLFYASLAKEGTFSALLSYVGYASLATFIDSKTNDEYIGEGYYATARSGPVTRKQLPFLHDYKRKDFGTDIHIMGFNVEDPTDSKNVEEGIIYYVIKNFLVSIYYEILTVTVNKHEITKDSLEKYLDKIEKYEQYNKTQKSRSEVQNLVNYYHILSSNDKRIIKIPIKATEDIFNPGQFTYEPASDLQNCDAKLFIMKSETEDFNRRIMTTREHGMKISEEKGISTSIQFTGVLIINESELSKAFRKMEGVAHDVWSPKNVRGNKEQVIAEDNYKGLKRFIKEQVHTKFGRKEVEKIDAYGASDFICKKKANGNVKGGENEAFGKTFLGFTETKHKVASSGHNEIGKRKRKSTTKETEIQEEAKDVDTKEVQIVPPTQEETKGQDNPGDNNTEKKKKSKEVSVNKHLFCVDKASGRYRIQFKVPRDTEKAQMKWNVIGETGSLFSYGIKKVDVISGEVTIDTIENDVVTMSNVKKNDTVTLDVEIDMNQYCRIEVTYYEC